MLYPFESIAGVIARLPAESRRVVRVNFLAAILALVPTLALAQQRHPQFPVTDGPVWSLALSGNTLYVGGEFSVIGRPNGAGVPVDVVNGKPLKAFPIVHGIVCAVEPDGTNGWFIAGDFDDVDGVPRSNLARIRSDLSVDAWNPAANGPVRALAVTGQIVYAGGDFTAVGGSAHRRIVALDAVTGAAAPWTTEVDSTVLTLAVKNGVVYLGGYFMTMNGLARHRLAAVDGQTGAARSWNPDANGGVRCLALDDEVAYVGGDFLQVASVTRNHIAAVDLATGGLTPWNGTANNVVCALAVSGSRVYVGGHFTNIGGQPRRGLAALSRRWWQAEDWNPATNSVVNTLRIHGSSIYFGGVFTSVGGEARYRAACVDTVTGSPGPWAPRVNGAVLGLVVSDSRVYLGGAFSLVGGQIRHNIAAIDRTTEQVTPWDPDASGLVSAIAAAGNFVYFGGFFDRVGSHSRACMVQVDSTTGDVTPWTAQLSSWGRVRGIGLSENKVFIARDQRPQLIAYDRVAGGTPLWSQTVQASNTVMGVVSFGQRVFAMGWMDSLGAFALYPRAGAVMLDADSGQLQKAFHAVPQVCLGASTMDGVLYVGGRGLGAIDMATGEELSWGVSNDQWPYVQTLATASGRIYVGGWWSLDAIDRVSSQRAGWTLGPNGSIDAMAASEDGVVYVGGELRTSGGEPPAFLAAVDDPHFPLDVTTRQLVHETSALQRARPDPFATSTVVHFDLARSTRASLDLFDVTGRRVRSILSEAAMTAGPHEIRLRRDGLAAGVFWLRLAVDSERSARKVVVLP